MISLTSPQTQGENLNTTWVWKESETLKEIMTKLDVEWTKKNKLNGIDNKLLDAHDEWGVNTSHTSGSYQSKVSFEKTLIKNDRDVWPKRKPIMVTN